VYWSCVAAE
jgi:hypothetical protein